MVYNLFKNVDGQRYKMLIDFLGAKSDVFTVMLPQYHYFLLTEANCEMMSDMLKNHKIGDKFHDEDCDLEDEEQRYRKYLNNIQPILNRLEPNLVRTFETASYGGQLTGYACTAYVYKISENSLDLLKAARSLFSWQRLDGLSEGALPCDLCFYCEGKPILETVAHENEAWLYLNREDADKLIKMGIKLEEDWQQYDADICEYASIEKINETH